MNTTDTIAHFERLKCSLEAARDMPQPVAELHVPHHLCGLRAGLQVAIDAIAIEIRLLHITNNHNQGEQE